MKQRVFVIVLDSCGCGELPDAGRFGDEGSHTLKALCDSGRLSVPNLQQMGLFNIDGIGCGTAAKKPTAVCHAKRQSRRYPAMQAGTAPQR